MIAKLNAKIRAAAGDDLARKLAGGAFAALIIKTASAGLAFLMFVLLARAMSDVEYGRFASGFSLALFLALAATMGQPKLVLRFLSRYLGADDAPNALAVIDFSRRRVILAALLMALACTGVASVMFFAGLVGDAGIWISVGLLVVAFALAEYYSHALRALGQVLSALAPRDVVWRSGVVALAGAAILAGAQLRADQVLLFCGVTLGLVVAMQCRISQRTLIRQAAAPGQGQPAAGAGDIREWRKATPGLALLAIMGEAFQHLFVVATGLALTVVDAGHFFAAVKTTTLLSLPLVATNMITAPMISHYYQKGETTELQRVCRLAISLAGPITLAGLTILVFFGRPILGMFAPGFSAAYPALLVISFGRLTNALCGPTGVLMMMTGHERRYLVYVTVSNLTGLTLLGTLVSTIGITGAAVGVMVAQCAWNLLVWNWARRTLRVDPTALSLLRPFLPAPAPRPRPGRDRTGQ